MILTKFVLLLMASTPFSQKKTNTQWKEIDDMQYYAAAPGFNDSFEAAFGRCTELNPKAHLAVFSSDASTLHAIAELISDSLFAAEKAITQISVKNCIMNGKIGLKMA